MKKKNKYIRSEEEKEREQLHKEEADHSEFSEEELQQAYEQLQDAETPGTEEYYSTGDVVYDVIFFFITVAGAFFWLLLMLLFISFIFLSVLHFKLKYMILASAIFAVIAGIWYIRKKAPSYRGKKYKSSSDSGRRGKKNG